VGKLNLSPGGAAKEALIIRNGTYLCAERGVIQQPMFFQVGDVLLVEMKCGKDIRPRTTLVVAKTTQYYPVGSVIDGESELLEVQKGMKQLLLERGVQFGAGACLQERHVKQAAAHYKRVSAAWEIDRENVVLVQQLLTLRAAALVAVGARDIPCSCARCTLQREEDFKNQKSGLEEIYAAHNREHGTRHYCMFLPKFHPELNLIERFWSRMKWSIRKYSNGKIEQLRISMTHALSSANLPCSLIRRYIRLVSAYYIAYQEGKDIIQAEFWIRKHRSHRGCSAKMDA
jgi:transposase